MADDIVTRLHEEIDSLKADVQVLRDAISEIERLRAAGDALAEALSAWIDGMDAFVDDAERLRAWQEARRADPA